MRSGQPNNEPAGDEEDLVKPFDQHFCCEDIADKGMSGEDCKAIGPESINSCTNVLYCAGNWKKKDGIVTCE